MGESASRIVGIVANVQTGFPEFGASVSAGCRGVNDALVGVYAVLLSRAAAGATGRNVNGALVGVCAVSMAGASACASGCCVEVTVVSTCVALSRGHDKQILYGWSESFQRVGEREREWRKDDSEGRGRI